MEVERWLFLVLRSGEATCQDGSVEWEGKKRARDGVLIFVSEMSEDHARDVPGSLVLFWARSLCSGSNRRNELECFGCGCGLGWARLRSKVLWRSKRRGIRCTISRRRARELDMVYSILIWNRVDNCCDSEVKTIIDSCDICRCSLSSFQAVSQKLDIAGKQSLI